MKNVYVAIALMSAALLESACSSTAVSSRVPGYLTSPKGQILVSDAGQCWRTVEWRPELAINECDPEVVAQRVKKAAEKKAAEKEAEKKEDEKPAEVAVDNSGEHPGTEHNGFVYQPPVPEAPRPVSAAVAAAIADISDQPISSTVDKKNLTKTEVVYAPLVLGSDASFRFNDDHLTQAGKDAVTELAGIIKMRRATELKITVEGHTDRVGSAAANVGLSRRRAAAVKAALIAQGVAAKSIEAVGKGASIPITQRADCPDNLVKCELIDCLRPDRRVEIKVRGKMENGVRTVPVEGSTAPVQPPSAAPPAISRRTFNQPSSNAAICTAS